MNQDKVTGTRLKPVYFAFGQEKETAQEKSVAWVAGMGLCVASEQKVGLSILNMP
jgi:hypothetical protein